jgi:uncharacterized membrane protein/nitrite reductase/ring-hydroxylating ferredoxin subunit
MKSRAHIKGHPLHPILVSFPIAFFAGTLLFDILGFINSRNDLINTGMYLEIAGIGFTLLAAVPGIIDYFHVVPPKSSAKKRAVKHGLTNTFMVVVFAIACWLRQDSDISFYIIIGLETFGVILLSIAGWLGGTLVFRNQIGVDIRYADAGKWTEEKFAETNSPITVAKTDELKLNQMKLIHVGRKRIVICKTEKGYKGFDDRCTHKGASLAGGSMICGTVQCPWHGSQFDIHTGDVKAGPARDGIKTYNIVESGDSVILDLSEI